MNDEQHTHYWTPAPATAGWACTDCTATCATCGTCAGPTGTERLVCSPCLRHTDRLLDDIDDALSLHTPAPRTPISSPGNMRLVPGGTGPGAITQPADVRAALNTWADAWAEHTGHTLAGTLDYLKDRHLWAAQNPGDSQWLAYLRDLRRLRHQARRLAGLLPERLPEPCVHCGGTVVQDWADRDWRPLPNGLSDHVRCLGCGMTWGDLALWRFSSRQHIVELPTVRPDSLVTLSQARMLWPAVPAATMRQWAKRARVQWEDAIALVRGWWDARTAFGTPAWVEWQRVGWTQDMLDDAPDLPTVLMRERGARRGETTYRVGDLQALVDRWSDERRAGRPSVAGGTIGG